MSRPQKKILVTLAVFSQCGENCSYMINMANTGSSMLNPNQHRIGVLPDARSLLATVTYLDQTLARPVIDSPDLVAHQMLTDLTLDQPTSWLRSSPLDLSNLHTKDGAALSLIEIVRDLEWMRPLTLV